MGRYSGVTGSMDEVGFFDSALSKHDLLAQFYSQALDSDQDMLPNLYEFELGFDPVDSVDGGTADTDGDGYTNVDEYLQQTDPWVNPLGYAASVNYDAAIAYWRMDDATSTLVDESANYDGTYVSGFTQLSAPAVGEG